MGSVDRDGSMDPGATLERLEQLEATFLWVACHNYAGLTQAKIVPRARFAEVAAGGVSFAKANWDFTIDDLQVDHAGFGANTGDFLVVPDPATVVPIPYRPGVAQAFGDLLDGDRTPWAGDPRAILSAAVAGLGSHGLRALVAFESEFLLATPDGAGWVPSDRGRMFTIDEVAARWPWATSILDALETMGVPVHQFASEYGRGQYEISLLPADPLAAVDRFLLARETIRALSRDAGHVATFMPKPWSDVAGNGVHVHISLWDAAGREVMPDPASRSSLSPVGEAAVAGLLRHAPAQAALSAATPNSYKRLLPGSWAPAHVAWAIGNRAALVRIPGRGPGCRIEYRMGDASANPYLMLAGLIASIADGIATSARLPREAVEDIGHLSDAEAAALGCARLPTDLGAAVAALEADETLMRALGPVVGEHYPALKRFERGTYEAAVAADGYAAATDVGSEVTDWERATYLEHV